MRRRTPLAFAGFVIVGLGAVIGFASFTAERPAPQVAEPERVAPMPDLISGRLTAAILSSQLDQPDATAPTPGTTQPETSEDAAPSQVRAPWVPSTTPTTTAAPVQALADPTPPPPTTAAPTTTAPPPPTIPVTQPPVVFTAAVERWRPLVATYFPPSLLDEALSVMECESRGDPNAENRNSSAAGLFQFIASTWNWASSNAGFTGVTVYDPEANIATAAFLVEYSLDNDLPAWQHWVCQPDIAS